MVVRIHLFHNPLIDPEQRVLRLFHPLAPQFYMVTTQTWEAAQAAVLEQAHTVTFTLLDEDTALAFVGWAQQNHHLCIVLSAHEDLAHEALVLKAGAANYLTFDMLTTHILARAVRHALLRYEHLRENVRQLKLYETVVRDQTVMICRFLPDGTLTYVNDVYCRYFQKSRESLLGSNLTELVHPEDIPDMVSVPLDTSQLHLEFENRAMIGNGECRWTRWITHTLYNEQQQIVEFQSIGQDIHRQKLAELALSQEQLRLHTILRNLEGFAVLLFDHDLRYQLAEGSIIHNSTTFTKHNVEGRTVFELAGERAETLAPAYYRSLNGETSIFEHFAYERFYEFTVVPVVEADGSINNGLVIIQDIHERRLLAEALAQSEARYRAIVQDQIDLVSRFDPDLRLTFVNDAYCRFYGKPRTALLGLSITDLSHPDYRENLIYSLHSLTPERSTITLQELAKNQDATGEPRWLEWANRAIFDEAGVVVEYQGVGRDITERRKTQMEIQRQADILDMVRDSIITTDAMGVVLSWNQGAEQMYGLAASDAIGRWIADLMRVENAKAHRQAATNDMMRQGFYQGEQQHYNAAGELFTALVTMSGVKVVDTPSQVVIIISDITALRQQEHNRLAMIAQQERIRILRQFIDNASHDLMTPLTTLKTSLYLLERVGSSDDRIQYIHKLHHHLHKLETLLQSMLNMVRLENDVDQALSQDVIDLNELLRGIFTQLRIRFIEQGHQATLQLPERPISVMGDASLLRHAIEEIMINGFQYTPAQGSVTIDLSSEGMFALIAVSDTGIGIASEDLPHIFEHFYRGDKARNTLMGGAGLGLTLAHRIITTIGGNIRVHSQPLQGSRFTIALPLLRQG